MLKKGFILSSIITTMGLFPLTAVPCTAIFMSNENSKIVGRTMDWPEGTGFVEINARGIRKQALLIRDGSKPVEWVSNYGNIAFNLVETIKGKGKMAAALGGMNEKGLWAATLWVHTPPEVRYQDKDRRPTINNWQLQQYILDNFQSVEEVIKGISKVRISGFEEGDYVVSIHWFVADPSGDSALIEFPNGKLRIHRNPEQKVMTNSFYEHSQDYLRLYEGFGGKFSIPDPNLMDPTSENRYLMAAYLSNLELTTNPNISTKTALKIMGKLKQTVNKRVGSSDSITQWVIAYDLSNKQVAWYTKLNPKIRKLNMADIDFSPLRQTFNVNGWYVGGIKKSVIAL